MRNRQQTKSKLATIRFTATLVLLMGFVLFFASSISEPTFKYTLGILFGLLFFFEIIVIRSPEKNTQKKHYRIAIALLFGLMAYLLLVVAKTVLDIENMMSYFLYSYGVIELVFVIVSLENFDTKNIPMIIGNSFAGLLNLLVGAIVIRSQSGIYTNLFIIGLVLIFGALRHIIFQRVINFSSITKLIRRYVQK